MKDHGRKLVSCICVTYNRVSFLKKSVRCFRSQTYPRTELLIIYRVDDHKTKEYLDSLEDENIVGYALNTPKLTLGDIRNEAVSISKGTYFCNWDDDDWYHPDRIMQQVDFLERTGQTAVVLTNLLVYDQLTGNAYFSMFRLWETSLLCKKQCITKDLKYGSRQRGEDAVLVNAMMEKGGVVPLSQPNLVIYFIHGSNTMNRGHYEKLFKLSQPLSIEKSEVIKGIIEGEISTKEAKILLSGNEFLTDLNCFYKKAGYLSLSGLTIYRSA